LDPNRPSESFVFNKWGQYQFRNHYGSGDAATWTNSSDGGTYNVPAWIPGPPYAFWFITSSNVEFRAGFSYEAKITLSADSASGTKPKITKVTPGLIAFIWDSCCQWRLGQDFFTANTTYVRGYTDAMLGAAIESTPVAASAVITPTVTGTARLVFRMEFEAGSQSNANWKVAFKNMTWTRLPSAWTEPTLVDGSNEFITIPKMPTTLDETLSDADNCPHLASALKHWHDPTIWPGASIRFFLL